MKKFGIYLVAVLALVGVSSCSNEEETNPARDEKQTEEAYAAQATVTSSDANYVASDNGGTINFKTTGGSVTLSVSCGCNWIAENSASDLFPSSTTSTLLTVTAEQNTVEKELTGTITFMTENYRITFATVHITQAAYGAPEITVETTEWAAPAIGELTTEIAVEASTDWTVESDATWLTVTKAGTGLVLTAEENGDAAERSTRVTLTCTDGIKTAHEYVAVTQDGLAHLTLSDEALEFNGEEGSATVTVESNFDWEYSYDSSNGWFTVSKTNEGLTVNVAANEGDTREGVVTLSAGDGKENVAEAQLAISQVGSAALILTYTISAANTSVRLPIYGGVNCTVDWGDGTVQNVTSNRPSHTYAEAGDYDVSINGTVPALYSNGISSFSSPLPIKAVKQWGKTGLTDMKYAFYYCTKLASLPDEVGDAFAEVTSFSYAFYECTSLKTVPAGLFENCVNATSFARAFYECTSLEEIQDRVFYNCSAATDMSELAYGDTSLKSVGTDLFANCSSNTTFYRLFYNCSALTKLPEGIFDGCSKVTDFSYSFYGCSALASLPSGVFDSCTEVDTFASAFYGCKALKAFPTGIFDKTTKVTTFFNAFHGCSGLTEFPSGMFANCTEVTTFGQAFYGCSSVTALPDRMFANCTKNTTFYMAFYSCSSLKEIPEGLFDNCPEVTTFSNCFSGCSSLTKIPGSLFAKCPEVTTYYMVFQNCTSLETVPEGLFDYATEATNLSWLFYHCTKLKTLPEKLFANCTKATTFNTIFYECSALEELPAGMFDNCVAAEDFSFLCAYCSSLKTVPEGLFNDCPEVTTFSAAFQNTSLGSIPNDFFSNNLKVTDFSFCFNGYSLPSVLTGESPFDMVDGEKVHLYERENYPDIYVTPTTTKQCFYSCTGLSDYANIPSSWVN